MNGDENCNELPPIAPTAGRVLVIDDELPLGLSCRRALSSEGYEVVVESDSEVGLQTAISGEFDIVLLDLMMPKLDGIELLGRLKSAGVASEVVIITAFSTLETAVEAMRLGAADYLGKPFTPAELRMTIDKVAQRSALIRENQALRRELEVAQGFEGMIGRSLAMERVFSVVKRVAPTDGTVLITGESGTGKEMIVQALHRLSPRKNRPLLACDCSALASTLLESELFGHVKGAFSGAIASKQGLFEAAHRGTLFLDEVANLSWETQGKLLRVLETKRVRKVGDTAEHEVEIRLVAATNRSLAEMVAESAFREDLYYRLNVVPIEIPPLRERRGDIPLLANSFLTRLTAKMNLDVRGFTPEAMAHLESYHWPGNVRELRNMIERIAILCDSSRVEVRHLPREIRESVPGSAVSRFPESWDEFRQIKNNAAQQAAADLERQYLTEILARCENNVSKAAQLIGMRRPNLHALLKKHGLR